MVRSKLLFALALPLCAALGLLTTGAAGREDDKKATARPTGYSGMVCPVFYWGNFMGFYYYMGEDCSVSPTQTVGLASTVPLNHPHHCTDPDCAEKCIDVGSFYKLLKGDLKGYARTTGPAGRRLGSSHHYYHYYLEAGVHEADQVHQTPEQVIQPGTEFTVPDKTRVLAYLELKRVGIDRYIKVALYKVTIRPTNMPVLRETTYRVGHEVRTTAVPTVTIPRDQITVVNGKACLVNHDGGNYMVVLGRRTPDPQD